MADNWKDYQCCNQDTFARGSGGVKPQCKPFVYLCNILVKFRLPEFILILMFLLINALLFVDSSELFSYDR